MAFSVPTSNNMGAPSAGHIQACRLHDEEGPAVCSGYLRRSRTFHCTKKAVISPEPNMMPTCRLHRDQLKRSSLCQVPLSCGFQCARLCEWKPHSYSRCPTHIECPMTCYFLKIPIELRVRIYGYLLPDQDIPAQFHCYELRSEGDRASICMGILRVSRQIHDEAVGLLYGCRAFTIQLSGAGLNMCNSLHRQNQQNQNSRGGGGNHALQDYQMQLMLLEQQNKKRLMMARNLTHPVAGPSTTLPMMPLASTSTFPGYNIQISPSSSLPFSSIIPPASDPVWDSPLCLRYFNKVQSFRVEICLPVSAYNNNTIMSNYHSSRAIASASNVIADPDTAGTQLQSRLYEYSDYLHKLVSRLQLTHRRLSRLEIVMKFGDIYHNGNEDQALSAMDLLLRPFRRLYNVGSAEIYITRSMLMNGTEERQEVPYLINNITQNPKGKSSIAEASESLNEYLTTWSKSLSASTPSLLPTAAFHAYWKFDALIAKLYYHCHHGAAIANPDLNAGFEQFSDLRRRARVAREDEDIESFKAMFELVMGIWQRYLDWERVFQESVWCDIQGVLDTVAEAEM